jgi:hypothetical protein
LKSFIGTKVGVLLFLGSYKYLHSKITQLEAKVAPVLARQGEGSLPVERND